MKHLHYTFLAFQLLALMGAGSGSVARAGGSASRGERVDPATHGAGTVESMDAVMARDRVAPPRRLTARDDAGLRFGEWAVPNRRSTSFPKSGVHNVVNKWGDLRMGIGFPEVVDVHGAYFAGQQGPGVWARAIRVIGFHGEDEVARTGWFDRISDIPTWFEMDLCGVDRIIILAKPGYQGGGWYGMDDLTYSATAPARQAPVVVDFEDVSYSTTLSATPYAGLSWEFGTGFDLAQPPPPPRVPPGMEPDVPGALGAPGGVAGIASGNNATLPGLERSFQGVIRGDAGSLSFPPDTIGAVGPNHFVEAANRNFAVYDKSTGAELMNVHLGTFLPGSNGDPRVLFDQYAQRWIVIATDFNAGQRIYLAVSTSQDPMGNWFKTSFVTSQGSDLGKSPDYPTLGVDADGIYTGAYMIGGSSLMTLFVIDKAPLIDPVPSLGTVTAFRELAWEGALQPVHTYGDPGGEYVISRANSVSLRVRRVDGPMTAPTLVELGVVTIPSHNFPTDVPALGSGTLLDSVGSRLMMAVYRDGSIWTAHTVNINLRAACRWYQVDPVAMTLEQTGTVADPILHYFFPSIMVNKFDGVVMAFSGSSPFQYPGAYYTGRRATDPPGEMAPPFQYRAGDAAQNNLDKFGRNRWGDYSYISLDPVDEDRIWTVQEYAHDVNIWGTWVGVLNTQDCNVNGVEDPCDVSCGAPGGACDVPGCGTALDCNGNGLPDACDTVNGACCFADGACCDVMSDVQCADAGASFYGAGTDCAGPLDPACQPADARISCSMGISQALAGGSLTLDLFVDDVAELNRYQAAVTMTTITGSGTLSIPCDACTGGYNESGCGARIDDTRADYVFAELQASPSVDCATNIIDANLDAGGVTLSASPAYLGEFTVTVSPDATPGTQFEISVSADPASTLLRDPDDVVIRFLPGTSCIITVMGPDECAEPLVEAGGAKALVVRMLGAAPQALLVTGDAGYPDAVCVSGYIQDDGTLAVDPIFRTPAQWSASSGATTDGAVVARGVEIIPSTRYQVQTDCGSPGLPELSATRGATTWAWGDVDGDGVSLFNDILLVVKAFQNDFSEVTLEGADLDPCEPNRSVNFGDILAVVRAFQGSPYTDSGCSVPCP